MGSGGSFRPTGGGGGGGFDIPGGTRGVAGGGMGLLVLCVLVAFFLLTRGGGDTSTTPDQQDGQLGQGPQPTESAGGLLGQLAATEAPLATARATAATEGDRHAPGLEQPRTARAQHPALRRAKPGP